MTDLHWAIFALRDIQNAIDAKRYEIACHHITDAIAAIIAVDEDGNGEKDAADQSASTH